MIQPEEEVGQCAQRFFADIHDPSAEINMEVYRHLENDSSFEQIGITMHVVSASALRRRDEYSNTRAHLQLATMAGLRPWYSRSHSSHTAMNSSKHIREAVTHAIAWLGLPSALASFEQESYTSFMLFIIQRS